MKKECFFLLIMALFVKQLVNTLNINQNKYLKSIAQAIFNFSLWIYILDSLAEFGWGGSQVSKDPVEVYLILLILEPWLKTLKDSEKNKILTHWNLNILYSIQHAHPPTYKTHIVLLRSKENWSLIPTFCFFSLYLFFEWMDERHTLGPNPLWKCQNWILVLQ